jgi:hypothetical protein
VANPPRWTTRQRHHQSGWWQNTTSTSRQDPTDCLKQAERRSGLKPALGTIWLYHLLNCDCRRGFRTVSFTGASRLLIRSNLSISNQYCKALIHLLCFSYVHDYCDSVYTYSCIAACDPTIKAIPNLGLYHRVGCVIQSVPAVQDFSYSTFIGTS